MNRKIFFTGGKGFIGREIIPLFRKDGYDVVDPSSKELDLLDSDAVKNLLRMIILILLFTQQCVVELEDIKNLMD